MQPTFAERVLKLLLLLSIPFVAFLLLRAELRETRRQLFDLKSDLQPMPTAPVYRDPAPLLNP